MFLKLSIIIFSFLFSGALGVFVWHEDWYFFVLFFLLIFSWLLIWPFIGKIRFLAIPFFLSIGSLNLLYLIDGRKERIFFIVLAGLIYYLSLLGVYRLKKYDCDQTAQAMINLATIIAIFFWFTSSYGWYLNFAINSWILIFITIISTFFIVFPSLTISFIACYKIYYRQNKTKVKNGNSNKSLMIGLKKQLKVQKTALFFAFIIAFLMGEVVWGLLLWPFGYLVTGMTGVIFFFLFWEVIRKFIQKKLTKRFILVNMGAMIMVIIAMLITSPWRIIN